MDPNEMKIALSTINEPYVLRNFPLDWSIFNLTFDEWCQRMDDHIKQPVHFACGTRQHTDLPYWERFRTSEQMTFCQFLSQSKQTENNRWHSHSYKDIISWPDNIRKSISFAKLGFPNTEDILFWLGSAGANTPCHYDTYGFNIVVQIYGKKSWIILPPSATLTPTRIPFEESSVYCKQNFYSPNDMKQFNDIGKNRDVYEIVLNPGDILIVPPRFWHYVENCDTCLSVNTWIPNGSKDCLARLGECFVRMQVDQITQENMDFGGDELKQFIYNPNEMNEADLNLMGLFKPMADIVIENQAKIDTFDTAEMKEKGQDIRNKYSEIFSKLQPISYEHFKALLKQRSGRYDESLKERKKTDLQFEDIEYVINAVCNPKTIDKACQLYIQQIINDTNKKK